jgi:hypothetical protein
MWWEGVVKIRARDGCEVTAWGSANHTQLLLSNQVQYVTSFWCLWWQEIDALLVGTNCTKKRAQAH